MWRKLCVIFALIYLDSSEATICKPYSTFKFDCNDCICSGSGREYSCTNKPCTVFQPSKSIFDDEYDSYTLHNANKDFKESEGQYNLQRNKDENRILQQILYPYHDDQINFKKQEEEADPNKLEDVDENPNDVEDIYKSWKD